MSNSENSVDPTVLELSAADLVVRIERLSEAELHELPFGVIRLDEQDRVAFYSRTEARQSGFGGRTAQGRSFFTELAPCMNDPRLGARTAAARARGTLDVTFEQVGDFSDAEREIRVRMCSAANGGLWLFIERIL